MIETARLRLRDWRESDKQAFFEGCATAAVMEYLGGPIDRPASDAIVDRQRTRVATHGYCFWPVERKDDGALLGCLGLKPGDEGTPIEGEVEIGWRLREDSWGRGYAREAAEASLAWAWTNLDCPRIVAVTVSPNRASWGLMERLGMVRTPALDFAHPKFAADDPLSPHVAYVLDRPAQS